MMQTWNYGLPPTYKTVFGLVPLPPTTAVVLCMPPELDPNPPPASHPGHFFKPKRVLSCRKVHHITGLAEPSSSSFVTHTYSYRLSNAGADILLLWFAWKFNFRTWIGESKDWGWGVKLEICTWISFKKHFVTNSGSHDGYWCLTPLVDILGTIADRRLISYPLYIWPVELTSV